MCSQSTVSSDSFWALFLSFFWHVIFKNLFYLFTFLLSFFFKAIWKQMPVSTVETPKLMPRVLALHHHRFPPLRCQNRLVQCNGRNAFHFGVQFSFGSCTSLTTHQLFSIFFVGFFQPPDNEILDLFFRTQFLTSALAAISFWGGDPSSFYNYN